MNINDIFAYGSTANILLRVKSARTIDGVSYAANEPYTLLNNVTVDFQYSDAPLTIGTPQPLVSWKEEFPVTVTISGAPSSKKISALLFKKAANSTTVTRHLKNSDLSGGQLFLSLTAKDFFLYKGEVKDTGFTFDTASGLFTIVNYSSAETYRLFYSEDISKQSYSLESPTNAYFTLEFYGTGNKNGQTMNLFMRLDSCALLAEKQTNFNGGESNSVSLIFSIIKNTNKDYLVFE